MMRASVDQTLRASLPCKRLPNVKERNIISLTKSQICDDKCTRTSSPDVKTGHAHGQTTQHANCTSPQARNLPTQRPHVSSSQRRCCGCPETWKLALALAGACSANLHSMGRGQPGAMQGVCKGRAATHLLLPDVDVKLGAVRKQGVWCPPAAVLTACRAHWAQSCSA